MDLFSSNAEETINKSLNLSCFNEDFSLANEIELIEYFDLKKCFAYIKENGFFQVCLQFPDSLLQYSVDIALWLEKNLDQKVYILGDATFGSCCVDEVAAQHVGADAVIHFGHSCLSPTARLPVLHVLPKATLDMTHFLSSFSRFASGSTGPILLLYDVAFSHCIGELRDMVMERFAERVVVSQLGLPGQHAQPCGAQCDTSHRVRLLGRQFCCQSPASVVYVAHKLSQNALNFALSFREANMLVYSKDAESSMLDFNKTLRRRLFLVEKIKDARTLGVVVGTLSVDKYLEAVERVKSLAAYRGKRCYVFSVGKPNPAKLANFPEIEVFVLVSCPEACLDNEKEYLRPVVTLLETELALNPNRQWDEKLSVDFTDFLESGSHFQALPEGQSPLEADVSLVSNRIRSDTVAGEADDAAGTDLSVRDHYQLTLASTYSASRSWRGLEQALGETPAAQLTQGRSGIPLAYEEEKAHSQSSSLGF